MHLLSFLLLFSVMASCSSFSFANPTSFQSAAQNQPDKIAARSSNAVEARARVYSEQERAEYEQKRAEANQKAEERAAKKAEARAIASVAKHAISLKILGHWQAPPNSTGQEARARIILSPSGSVQKIVVSYASNQEFKDSIEKAVYSSAPFALPKHPDVQREARLIYMSFQSQ